MSFNQKLIIKVFRYIWLAGALFLILFILHKGIYTKRDLVYDLDFSQSLTRDIRGWYPESRFTRSSSSSIRDAYDVIGEPLYMKIYVPVDFDLMTVTGSFYFDNDATVRLGLKQKDGSWQWQDIKDKDFSLSFDLKNAQTKNNQLEIILSLPEISDVSVASLVNNWQITLSR